MSLRRNVLFVGAAAILRRKPNVEAAFFRRKPLSTSAAECRWCNASNLESRVSKLEAELSGFKHGVELRLLHLRDSQTRYYWTVGVLLTCISASFAAVFISVKEEFEEPVPEPEKKEEVEKLGAKKLDKLAEAEADKHKPQAEGAKKSDKLAEAEADKHKPQAEATKWYSF